MANNVSTPIGQRVTLIDPNQFEGQKFADYGQEGYNESVPLEDLSIFVELETSTKGRTLLTSVDGDNSGSNSGSDIKIKFLDGSEINGRKVLTTQYTDLTTDFSAGAKDENLGISNIDINFSSSYAPMITINFVDIRGSALFQNEKSKYRVFFKLPYPIFRLTIKGFYGKPVMYCLHMTKFNSKFNSQTGNFEITANFIGYTYAMLTDMLIGFLKAIPHTTVGSNIYKKYKTSNELITLGELIQKVSKLNDLAPKLLEKEVQYQELDTVQKLPDQIGNIRSTVTTLIEDLKRVNYKIYPDETVSDNIVVIGSDPLSQAYTQNNATINPIPNFNSNQFISAPANTNDFTAVSINSFVTESTKLIKIYNNPDKGVLGIDLDLFTKVIKYENVSRDSLKGVNDDLFNSIAEQNKLDPVKDLNKIIEKMAYINSKVFSLITPNQKVTVYDFNLQMSLLDDLLVKVATQTEIYKDNAADLLKVIIETGLGFKPTIRNILNIFTTQVEVLLESIYEVSAKAVNNKERDAEFIKKGFLPKKQLSDISTIKQIFPWPEYNNDDKETYLGKKGVLDNPENVPELVFIEDLYKAILTEAFQEIQAQELLDKNTTIWYGANPLDTKAINSGLVTPYQRLPSNAVREDIIREILIRAITFIGYSNKNLSVDEIKTFAKAESLIALENLKSVNDNNINAVANVTETSFYKNITGDVSILVNGVLTTQKQNVLKQSGSNWVYNYLFDDGETERAIPIDNFGGQFTKSTTPSNFLTNYNSAKLNKPKDSGTYIKIIGETEYTTNDTLPSVDGVDTNGKLILETLKTELDNSKKLKDAGFSCFNGPFGVQEFKSLDWGNEETTLDLRYMFYSDWVSLELYDGLSYGLSKPRTQTTMFDTMVYNKEKSSIKLATNKVFNKGESEYNLLYESTQITSRSKIKVNTTHALLGKNIDLFNTNEVTYPYNSFSVIDILDIERPISVFGSRLYYKQEDNKARALLFLHSLPWNGLNRKDGGPFNAIEINNLFSNRAGFINVPYLWPAFIGGLLYRLEKHEIIKFGETGNDKTYIPYIDFSDLPDDDEYLTTGHAPMAFESKILPNKYKKLGDLQFLPQQVKDEFIKEFMNFVSTDFKTIQNLFEIIDGTDIEAKYAQVISQINANAEISASDMKSIFPKNFDKYIIFTPILNITDLNADYELKHNYFLENKDNSDGTLFLVKLLNSSKWIANNTFRIWDSNYISSNRSDITVSETDINNYLNEFMAEFKGNSTSYTSQAQIKQIELAAFGTNENDDIKLNLYRTIKAIYDKWIGGSDSVDSILFQCGDRNKKDKALATKRGATDPKLIDSFRFVNRSFTDIGDDFIANPLSIVKTLMNNSNQSFYDFLSRFLSDNNFDFIALPSFIDYNSAEELNSIFQPITFAEQAQMARSGPSFVCMYVGQTSTKLDFGNDPDFINDGVDFIEGHDGPLDFHQALKDHEDKMAAFVVRYGQQNQNLFKDIILDQSEFSETAESLQITDAIAQGASQSSGTYAGQNMYNVYSVRSYKSEVEMLGNAMIQPMMYFQLSNIPMFHGAYLITSVKHSIIPNYMSTNFTGVRIKYINTPLITEDIVYSRILGEFKPTKQLPIVPVGGAITKQKLTCALTRVARNLYRGWNGVDSDLLQFWLDWANKKDYFPSTDNVAITTKIRQLASKFNFKEFDLIKVFSIESYGGNPKARGGDNNNFYGIIQWGSVAYDETLKSKADDISSQADITSKPFLRQLDYIDYYFTFWLKNVPTIRAATQNGVTSADLYLTVLSPARITEQDITAPLAIPPQARELYRDCT